MKEKSADRLELAQSIYQAALKAGFDNCGIISLDDMETFDKRLIERMEAVPESQPFYDNICMNADIRKRYPWAKSLVICTTWYGKYCYPEQLQGRYAKGFFLSAESKPMETNRQKGSLPQWFDEQSIRWDKRSIFGLRHAAFQAGLGIIRKNNFFYDEKGSWLELEGYVIDQECQLYRNQQLRPCSPGCNLCVKNCPTGSLSAPYTMNPAFCISYCTTFGKGAVPEGVNENVFGEWMIGCDRCQDVCPFNRHDWNTGEKFPGLEELLPLLKPETLLEVTDEELIDCIIPKTANHIHPEEIETLRRNALRFLRNQKMSPETAAADLRQTAPHCKKNDSC